MSETIGKHLLPAHWWLCSDASTTLEKIVDSPDAYKQQKAKLIDEGRWAELIY